MTAPRAALTLILVALGCRRTAPEQAETEAKMPVTVAAPRVGPLTAHVRATGSIDPAPGADWTVTAPQAASISALPFAAGDSVRKGSVLARFDAPGLRADLATRESELAQARSRLENARQAHARLSQLLEKGIAARREVEDARKELLDAQAALAQATVTRAAAADMAGRATAVAPFDGLLAQRWHNPGDLVDVNEHVVRLVDPKRLEVTAAVLLADVGGIVVGHAARVTVPGGEAAGLPAVVVGAPSAADPATGTAPARLRLSTFLPVGTPVQVEIDTESVADALVVPAPAVVRDADNTFVYVVGEDGKAHRHAVEVGLEAEDEVQILSGVQVGEKVIVTGQAELPDGAAVTVAQE